MHDLHCHTNLSACAKPGSSLGVMLKALKDARLSTAGIVNHLWDSAIPGASEWYAPQDMKHVLAIREEYRALSDEERSGIKLYFGCETEYVGGGRVALAPESAKCFDFVLVPPHHFHMKGFVRPADLEDADAIKDLMLERFFECCDIDFAFGLAHPFMVLGYPGRIDEILSRFKDEEFRGAFSRAAEKNKSIEVNIAALYQPVARDSSDLPAGYRRVFTIAGECGCKFHIGSDAHDTSRLAPERFAYARKFVEACGITLAEDPLAAR